MSTIEDDVMVKKIAEKSISETKQDLIDNMNFDDTAQQMAALKAIIFNTSESNETKLQFIKEELSAGRYQIYSEHIASKLLEYAHLTEQAEIA